MFPGPLAQPAEQLTFNQEVVGSKPARPIRQRRVIELKEALRVVPDFPQPGVLYRDIGPILANERLFSMAIDSMLAVDGTTSASLYGGIDARGFVFASAMATRSERGLVMIRKQGKLPPPVSEREYALEYGNAILELAPAPRSGEPLLLVDDLLATGGTLSTAASLAEKAGYRVTGAVVLIALTELHPRDFKLPGGQTVHSIISF